MKQNYFKPVTLLYLSFLVVFLGVHPQNAFAQSRPYRQAPMLEELVANGELPPVEERLPENPFVVQPFDEIGTYGGELRYAGTYGDFVTFFGWEYFTRWEADMSGVYPNIVESYETNDDASVYTFRLRPGMRWSDGMPFTADDILFAINDIYLNTEIYPSPPSNLVFDGEPVVVEKVDDYTVTFTFAGSYGVFPELLASWPSYQMIFFPKHWLEDYHMTYNPENVEAIMASLADYPELANANIQTWGAMFLTYALTSPWGFVQFAHQVDRPTLYPWVTTEINTANSTLTLERNPYYWKVDTDGNQLPYIDRLVLTNFPESNDVKLLGLLSGDFDTTKDPPQEDYALFVENQDASGLRVYDVPSDAAGIVSIAFNMNFSDEQKAAVYANRDFRIGVSHALNRQQIMVLVYDMIGTPSQIAPLPDSPLYNAQLESQYLAYDADLANEYLDRVLPEKDAEGYRLMPDGNRFVVNFQIGESFGLSFAQVTELIIRQLDVVGIAAQMETTTSIITLGSQNNLEATVYTGEGGSGISAILDPRWFVPVSESSIYATGWSNWFRNPTSEFAIEPPEHIKEQIELYEQVLSTPDNEERIRLMQEVLQIATDEFYVIGVARPPERYWLINEAINNLPELWFDGWIPGMQSATNPFQWYFAEQ